MTERTLGVFVGMPAALHLDLFGQVVREAFGETPYLVGSATERKDWRDVDVRLILDDEDYDALFPGSPSSQHLDRKWCAMVLAFSALGREMTGLPVDFQIQRQTHANERYPRGARMALGITGPLHRTQYEGEPT